MEPNPIQTNAMCPKVVEDIGCWPFFEGGRRGQTFLLGSQKLDRYLVVPDSNITLISKLIPLFDGKRSIDAIENQVFRDDGKRIDVRRIYGLLAKAGLIESAEAPAVDRGEFDRLSIKLISKDITRLSERLGPLVKRIFPFAASLAAMLVIAGSVLLALRPGGLFASQKIYSLGGSRVWGIIFLSMAMIGSYFLHESSHAAVALRFGLAPRLFEFRLYLGFIPMIVMVIPRLYTLPPRRRIYVWCAGVFGNLTIACSLGLLNALVHLGPSLVQVISKVIVANLLMSFWNVVPFLPTDGYFVFTTLIKRPNIRSSAFNEFKKWLASDSNKFKGALAGYFAMSLLVLGLMVFLTFRSGNYIRIFLLFIALIMLLQRNARHFLEKRDFFSRIFKRG